MVSRWTSWFVLLTLLCGCQSQLADTGSASAVDAEKAAVADDDGSAAAEVDTNAVNEGQTSPADGSARVIGAAMFREELAKHRGQVVLVDMWATW